MADRTNLAGTKRKRGGEAFYAVRKGRTPGIYSNWTECSAQVQGFQNATYRKFDTLAEAENFVAGNDSNIYKRNPATPTKFYGVHAGHNPGVYQYWHEVQNQIDKYKHPVYRSFKTRAEAEQFVATGQASNISSPDQPQTPTVVRTGFLQVVHNANPPIHEADYPPGEGPLPPGTEDGFDTSIILDETGDGNLRYRTGDEQSRLKARIARPTKDSVIVIHTDGSALGNGKESSVAGVGVYFGPKDKRNVSEGLAGPRQTNQRAELTGILRALAIAPMDRKIEIQSDSNYAIKCVTEWYRGWKNKNWTNAQGKPVENKDLVVKILDALEERRRVNAHRVSSDEVLPKDAGPWERGPGSVRFQWVKGHDKSEGNIAADALAVNGAKAARDILAGGNIEDEI